VALLSCGWTGARRGRFQELQAAWGRDRKLKPEEPLGRSEGVEGEPLADDGGMDRAREAAWIERARARDTDAFRHLVDAYRHVAYGVALRILGQPEEAEEAAQEAFVRAWNALPNFRGEAKFSTWLYRIVTRRAFDRLQAVRRRRGREVGVEEAEGLPGGEAPDVSGWQRARKLEKLVADLPDAQRAAITLFYLEERSVNEVAETLGMPPNTVKTHLSRARAALRGAWVRTGREDA
jgi:RNA polymerase sigma-70 factor (ECF subfamily)